MKVCTKCYNCKNLEDFHNDKKRKDGKYIICKECHYSYMRGRYKDPKVKQKRIDYHERIKNDPVFIMRAKQRSDNFYNSLLGRARTLFNNAKKSPAAKKHPFTLTLNHIIEGIEKGRCAVTGMEFQLINRGVNKKNHLAPSVDRIDSTVGYTDENTRIVCWWYNMAKGELTDNQMKNCCRRVVENET